MNGHFNGRILFKKSQDIKKGIVMHFRKLPTEDETCSALAWLLGLLKQEACSYQIVGGLAARAYGSKRPLVDIDLYVPGKHLENLSTLAISYLKHPPIRHKDDTWDLEYMSIMYENQKIEIANGDNPKIFNRSSRSWQVQSINYELSNRCQIFGSDLLIMPMSELLEYKAMLGRDVDMEDIRDITEKQI